MTGIRITAGTLRGRKLSPPTGDIRPTSSRAREAIFNILSGSIPDSRFLDLFAGTGVMSIEAISRGAREALAVDSSGRAITALQSLAAEWELPLEARRSDVLRFLVSSSSLEPFDVVYIDPPYDFPHYESVLSLVDQRMPLAAGAIVAIEHRKKRDIEAVTPLERLVHRESRIWGQIGVELYDLEDQAILSESNAGTDGREDERGPP